MKLLFTFLLIISSLSTYSQDDKLSSTILKVVNAFAERDETTINQLIHKEFNLVVLFRRGVFDEYVITDKIKFDQPIPEYLPYFGFKELTEIKYDKLPEFSCEEEGWSKRRLFCNVDNSNKLLSNIAKNLKKNRNPEIPHDEIKRFERVEYSGRRVILTDGKEGELIFHLTKFNDSWYLTVLDRATSDCSA